MTTSELTGQPVDTASEAWRHECEARYILNMPDRETRNQYLLGVEEQAMGPKGPYTKTVTRGIKHTRGEAEVERLRATVLQLHEIRKAKT